MVWELPKIDEPLGRRFWIVCEAYSRKWDYPESIICISSGSNDGDICICIYICHVADLLFFGFNVVLHNAESVYPEISFAKQFCKTHSVKNSLRDVVGIAFSCQGTSLLQIMEIAFQRLKWPVPSRR